MPQTGRETVRLKGRGCLDGLTGQYRNVCDARDFMDDPGHSREQIWHPWSVTTALRGVGYILPHGRHRVQLKNIGHLPHSSLTADNNERCKQV